MKRNGMCPICYIRQLLTPTKTISNLYDEPEFENGVALTPPMGWSSWNTFRNQINEDLIYETAVAMKEKGLADYGYGFINLDDNWHSSARDENGDLQGDLSTFPHGIPALIKKINALGLKAGLYASNGTLTCEDLPSCLGREEQDAYTIAKMGAEFFKYDFCHNIPISNYGPLVYKITLAKLGEPESISVMCSEGVVEGLAKFMPDSKIEGGKHVSGLDRNRGSLTFKNIIIEEEGEYTLTVCCRKKGNYEKFLMIDIDGDKYTLKFPPQNKFNVSSRTQLTVKLKKGRNIIKLFNPIGTRADSAMLQYRHMSKCLKLASEKVAQENNAPVKPILFSICEWGRNTPHLWGKTAGNMWRTTGDILPRWWRIMSIYNSTVGLYKYASPGHWNDPDMLEVGNGNLTESENRAHFSLWCMMNSPLVLGNDLRKITDEVLKIVTNRDLIAINQDPLGKQAKRIIKGSVDVLVKPLADKSIAVCVFNKRKSEVDYKLSMDKLFNEEYLGMEKGKYTAKDLWSGKTFDVKDELKSEIDSHDVRVYRLTKKD